ncbi:MAG TPA: c-type cytochrome [Thermodesulfovibrionales bacterium]|nr:c-type cytochrome [Thermodesulfovibrionales bacterium]
MKKILAVSAVVASVCLLGAIAFAKEEAKASAGETLFKQHCAVCHPDGGNIINPKKTLHKKDLDANGVKKAEDIMGKMRNPGPGMTKFDKKTISDKDAKEIAEYVLKAFQ